MNESGWLRRILALLIIVALALFLWGIVTVLLILFAAVLFSILLSWLASLTGGALRIGRAPALSLVLVLILSALGAAFWLFGSEISMQLGDLATSLPQSFNKIRAGLQSSQWGRLLISGFGPNISISVSRITEIVGSGAALVIAFFLILFGGIYLAAEPELYRSGILELVPPGHVSRAEQLLDVVGNALRLWLLGQLFAMGVVGMLSGLGLWLLGIPSAAALGLIATLAEFIPILGPIIGAFPAVIVAFGVGERMALYVILLYFIIQQIESNLLIPLIQERMVSLPPVLTLFAAVTFGLLFGLMGLLLATPLTVVGMVIVKMLYVEQALGKPVNLPKGLSGSPPTGPP